MHIEYSNWLKEAVPTEGTWRTKLSELRRVEAVYGDLDALYDEDELAGVIEELTYSQDDARNNRPNPSRIDISGDIRNNLASYKSAVVKYQRFRQDVETEAARPAARRSLHVEDDTAEDTGRALSLERDLQAALRASITQLDPDLTIIDGGAEKRVASGFIDILAKDTSGIVTVIELKATTARRDVLGQVAAYMGDIEEECGHRPRGIVIAPEFDPRLQSAARMIEGLTLIKYGFSFNFSEA